eukprot:Em0002g334a
MEEAAGCVDLACCNKDLDDDRKGDETLRSLSSPVPSGRTGVRADDILTDSKKNECNRYSETIIIHT